MSQINAPDSGKVDWEAVEEAWLDGKAANTRLAYRRALADFLAWAGVGPGEVTPGLARGWARHMAERGLSARTMGARLSAMTSFYEAALGLGWVGCDKNPFRLVERPTARPVATLGVDEVEAMVLAMDVGTVYGLRDLALVAVALAGDVRPAEVVGLRGGDVEGLDEWVRSVIRAYLAAAGRGRAVGSGGYVFGALDPERAGRLPGQGGGVSDGPLSVACASRALKKYARRAGVDPAKVSLSALRRAGRRMRRRGMRVEVGV